MPAGKGRYTVGGKGTHGCKGYPVVGGEGTVHGCHPTRAAAMQQQAAIYASENDANKAALILELSKVYELIDEREDVVDSVEKSEETVDEQQVSLDAFFAKGLPTAPKRSNSTGKGQFSMNLSGLTNKKPFG